MTRHEETNLWSYAARTLDDDERKLLEHHLEECAECSDALEAVVMAREALLLARQSKPLVAWVAIDTGLTNTIERALNNKATRWWHLATFAVVATVLAAVVTFAFFFRNDAEPNAAVAEAVEPEPAVTTPSIVEAARGLQLNGVTLANAAGTRIVRGSVLETRPTDGKATLHLADESHLRLTSSTTVTVDANSADAISLELGAGRLAVRASHRPRRSFIVHSGDLDVHVVGTVFSVSRVGRVTEVAVEEGRVRVAVGGDDSVFVSAGERARFAQGGVQKSTLTRAQSAELKEVKAISDESNAAFKPQLTPPPPPMPAPEVPALGGRLPRLAPTEAKARQLQPLPEVLVEAPPSVPRPPDTEWAQPPEPARAPPLVKDLETVFLEKAEAALANGTCENFLVGLEDIAQDAEAVHRNEWARILRARCYELSLRPRQAMNEYRKYLSVFPTGQFAQEAGRALGR